MDRTLKALSLDDVDALASKIPQRYEYLPLKNDFSIRLLSFSVPERSPDVELRNPSTQEPIPVLLHEVEFDLLEVDLRAQPKYQTLSYVWGDTTVTTEMKLKSGKTMKITDSLRAALVRIVEKREKLPIWVDQLCINQSDMPERTNQVSMMGTIYLSAQHAMIWLGEERDDYTEYFMQLIRAIRTKPAEEHFTLSKDLMESMVELKYDPERPTVKAKRWRSVQEILNRPWFQRAWVVQEAVLSKDLNMMIGRHDFRICELVKIIRAIHSLEYDLGGYKNSLAKTTKGWESLDAMSDMRDYDSTIQRPNNFWRFLCSVGCSWEATEKRDMVYAFLGLLNKPGLFAPLGFPVKPDYSAPLRSVYISLPRTFIDGLKNLDLLSQVIGDEPVSLLIPFHPQFRIRPHISF